MRRMRNRKQRVAEYKSPCDTTRGEACVRHTGRNSAGGAMMYAPTTRDFQLETTRAWIYKAPPTKQASYQKARWILHLVSTSAT